MRALASFKKSGHGFAKVEKLLRAMGSHEVLVGVPREETKRKEGESEEGGAINNAALGYIHEFGSPANNIPPRPHLVPGAKKVQRQCVTMLKKASEKEAAAPGSVLKAMHAVSLVLQSSARNAVTEGEGFEPLSERYKKRKERKGYDPNKPLIATAQYRNSIVGVVRQKSEK